MANFDIRNLGLSDYSPYSSGQQTPYLNNIQTPFNAGDIRDAYVQTSPLSSSSTSQDTQSYTQESFMKLITDFMEQIKQVLSALLQQYMGNGTTQGSNEVGGISDIPPSSGTPAPPQVLASTSPTQTPSATTGTGNVGNTNAVQSKSFDPATMINVEDFGAKGDGTTDNTAALQSAFDEAKRTGKTVYIPEGTFNHSGVITADGINVTGSGPNTVMRATNPNESAIKLTGNNGSISNLSTEVVAPNRSSMPDAAGILVQNANGGTVSNVVVHGAASNGIRLDGANNCNITNNMVTGTNADGIALMNGSCNNKVQNCVVDQAGDDAFSDDSYTSDAKQDRGNVFQNCLAQNNSYGRGFALMGSANDTIDGCYSVNTPGHGVAAGTDYNSGTMVGSGHTIKNSVFIGAKDTPIAADGMNLSNNQTTGSVPDVASILGFDPGTLANRYSYNASYMPGTGPGANNTAGNRT